MRRAPATLVLAGALLVVGLSHGHPLGNNTVNRQARIEVAAEGVSLRYLLDLAEIPTLLAAQEADTDGDGATSTQEWDAYAQRRGDEIRAGIEITAAGRPLLPDLATTHWQRVPGAAGLDTLRLEAHLVAPLEVYATARIAYRDRRWPDEAGWKEVIAVSGKGVRITWADVPHTSPSHDLTAYPADAGSEPNVLAAQIEAAAAPPEAPTATGVGNSVAASVDPPEPSPAVTRVAVEPPTPGAQPAPIESTAPVPPAGPATATQFGAFFRLGIHHIATGLDHLVFLLGLMAAQTSLRRLAWVVTAFTAAHSLTLGLAASGLVSVPGAWVEPAIGLTIAYVGFANLVGVLRHGAAVAFAFGLVHGFGFAGALAESLAATQIGGSGWLLDLALFNLGVETGQMAFVLLVLLLARAVQTLAIQWPQAVRALPACVVASLGAYWTIQRSLVLFAG